MFKMDDSKIRMIRVLLINESANPEWVSVPLVGWSLYKALCKSNQIHLVTQIRNRDAILRAGLIKGKDFTIIDSEAVAKRVYKFGLFLNAEKGKGYTTGMALFSLSYYYFEHLVWKEFGKRIIGGEFDVVHRLTPLSPTIPSLLAGKCKKANIPFVIGPLNGGLPWPPGFDYARHKEREWLSYVRSAYKLLPGYSATRSNAAAILVGSKHTLKEMPEKYHEKCFYVPENGIDPDLFSMKRIRKISRPIKIAFVGRLVPYKGADMLIEAVAPIAKRLNIMLEIFGDGPQGPELKALIERERLEENIRLNGWVEHSKLQEKLVDADVFAFPSIREFGGAVVLEAMALGLVPIVVDYGGPGELVSPETGFLVKLGSREQIIKQFREIITDLANAPEKINAKSDLAMRRAQDCFSWQVKAGQVAEVYKWVLGQRKDRPYF